MSASLFLVAAAAATQPAQALPPPCTPWGLVFFDSGSAAITSQARGILGNLVSAFSHGGGAHPIALRGHADRVGDEAANIHLSYRRAEAVRDYLLAQGVVSSRISIAALGESAPLVPTADGVAEPQNRYVEFAQQLPADEAQRRDAAWRRSGQPRPIC